ncbi:MAG TPA: hypothetical protein DCE41_02785 [Cytophagales bacterium]|nr:hypothetical protein [Cytophagales bacterium]HAA17817.1 hypothetical protein [Cytophagales bacterium]HAP58832.1 hypothetical protein [Cytophagales bacterium]
MAIRILRLSVLILLLAGIGFFSLELYLQETQKRTLQEEVVELSKAKYGLFSVEEWKAIITELVIKKVGEFQVEDADEDLLKGKVRDFLVTAIDTFEEKYKKENDKKSLGFLVNVGADVFDIWGELKKQIPLFTDHIMGLIEAPENQADLQGFVLQQLDTYVDETTVDTDYALRDSILSKYDQEDPLEARSFISVQIENVHQDQVVNRQLLFGLVGIALVLLLVYRSPTVHEYLLWSLMAGVLLNWGVLLPMISIDARVENMAFVLAGEPVGFQDQILYYKSKSILEVVELMMAQSQWELVGVGLLVLAFSVIFPVAKLAGSLVYLYANKLRKQKWLQFLVFKTGKWSMADVMVVTIMMTYLGFGSILGEQLKQLDTTPTNVDIVSTGHSTLEVGFYLFLFFVLLSLLISHRMQFELKSPTESVSSAEEK